MPSRYTVTHMFKDLLAIEEESAGALYIAGYNDLEDVDKADVVDLAVIKGIGPVGATWIKGRLKKLTAEKSLADLKREWMEKPDAAPVEQPTAAAPTPAEETVIKPAHSETTPETQPAAEPAPEPNPVSEPEKVEEVPASEEPATVVTETADESKIDLTGVEQAQNATVEEVKVEEPASTSSSSSGGGGIIGFLFARPKLTAIGALIVVALLIGGIWFAFFANVERAPDFEVTDTEGKKFKLSDYRGDKVVVLDFMFADCSGCKKLMPTLVNIYNKYKDDIVMLSLDTYHGDDEEDLEDFADKYGAKWRFALAAGNEVLKDYSVTEAPKTVVIDKDGYVTFTDVGVTPFSELDDEVDKAIRGVATRENAGRVGLFGLAFGAGIATFFSPCAFPLLPGYMTYYLSSEEATDLDRRQTIKKGVIQGTAPALGMFTFFCLIGLLAALIGSVIIEAEAYFVTAVAIVIIIMGTAMLMNIDIPYQRVTQPIKDLLKKLYEVVKGATKGVVSKETLEKGAGKVTGKEIKLDTGEGYGALYTYGFGYAMASTGCVAPLFIAIIFLAINSGGALMAFGALIFYGLGMGVLMIGVTVMVALSKNIILSKLRELMPLIKKVSAIVLIIVGIMLLYLHYTD